MHCSVPRMYAHLCYTYNPVYSQCVLLARTFMYMIVQYYAAYAYLYVHIVCILV